MADRPHDRFRSARFLLRFLLGRRLPVTRGTLRVSGVRGVVRIGRDRWGVPHIEAANDADAWFGLGFAQGQDRAFQLELTRRVARGTLAEWIGDKGLPIDRLSRRIGFARSAEQTLPVLDADAREVVEAFAAGVTAGNSLGLPKKPHEFAILGGRPGPWEAADVLAFVKLQSFALPSNWDAELVRLRVLLTDGPDALAALDPTATLGPVPGGLSAADALAADLAAWRAAVPPGGGSNAWVLTASRTATGRPLVANDPHLAPLLPSQWYLAHVRTPNWEVAGACFAGCPAFPAGHNGFAAWGITAGLTDNADLFLEDLGPGGRTVRCGDRFVDCPVRREVIKVKGRPDHIEEVPETSRGPVIGPALTEGDLALSLSAVWLRPLPVRGFLFAHRARSFEEFRRCFAAWPVLPLNVVYADTTGATGWQLVGQLPVRRAGHGMVPLPGRDEANGWADELVPFDQMPYAVNPPEGFWATANNAPPSGPDTPFLGADWLSPTRYEAIREALAESRDWTVERCLTLQLDVRSITWRGIRDAVLRVPAVDEAAKAAVVLLRSWDGRVSADSPAAAVFELFLSEMAVRVARARAPRSHDWVLGRKPQVPGNNLFGVRRVDHLSELMREQAAGWFARAWPEETADALASVVRTLRERFGPDPAGWAWGRIRKLTLTHALFGDVKGLRRAFNRGPVPSGGDADTINQAGVQPLNPLADTDNIPGLRLVIDVGDWAASRFVLAGGQSGNPLSPHHADLFKLWQRGDGVPIAFGAETAAAVVQSLELRPGGS